MVHSVTSRILVKEIQEKQSDFRDIRKQKQTTTKNEKKGVECELEIGESHVTSAS